MFESSCCCVELSTHNFKHHHIKRNEQTTSVALNCVVEELHYMLQCYSIVALQWSEAGSVCQPCSGREAVSSRHRQTDEQTDGQIDGRAGGARWPMNRRAKLAPLYKSTHACWCWSGPPLACVWFCVHVSKHAVCTFVFKFVHAHVWVHIFASLQICMLLSKYM